MRWQTGHRQVRWSCCRSDDDSRNDIDKARRSRLVLSLEDIDRHGSSLEQITIPIETTGVDAASGTTVTLSNLRRNLAFPDAGKLRRLLLREFGVRDDFKIVIDGVPLTPSSLDAPEEQIVISLPGGEEVEGSIWVTTRPREIAEPGIVIRVRGRAIGPPTFFGLEDDPEIPGSIRNRYYGEINADHLTDAVLPNWADWNENNVDYQAFVEASRSWLKKAILHRRDEESGGTQEEFVNAYREQIERLPPARRELARRALLRVFTRFYDDLPERKHDIAELVLDAFEQDEYWLLVQRIQEASAADVNELADLLEEWGFYQINGIATRARQRLVVIDRFESMLSDPATLELSGIHQALEVNLWLLGSEYELVTSNRSLSTLIRNVFHKEYSGEHALKRPDLFLAGIHDRYVLVELKRPSETINRDNVAQAERYRDIIRSHLPSGRIEVVVIGGKVDPLLSSDESLRIKAMSYFEIAIGARRQCEWLVSALGAT
ncbi:MAG: hypothetical protein R2849_22790 [Thermomicrobiales bacterium]